MAKRGEMPSFLASVHYRFRTPRAAIALNSGVVLVLSLYSNFAQAATFGDCGALCLRRIVAGPRSVQKLDPIAVAVSCTMTRCAPLWIHFHSLSQPWLVV